MSSNPPPPMQSAPPTRKLRKRITPSGAGTAAPTQQENKPTTPSPPANPPVTSTPQTLVVAPVENPVAAAPAAPLRRRKTPISASGAVTHETPAETKTPTETTNQSTVITDDIPDIDIFGDIPKSGSNDSGSFASTTNLRQPKRIARGDASLSFLQDDGVIVDDEDEDKTNLANLGKYSINKCLNEQSMQANREKFLKKMKDREKNFVSVYKKPKPKAEVHAIDQLYLEEELKAALKNQAEDIHLRAESYHPGKCNMSSIQIEEPLFKPAYNGFCDKYLFDSNDAISGLSINNVFPSIDKMKEQLQVTWYNAQPVPQTTPDIIQQISSLIKSSTKQISPTKTILDLGVYEGKQLIYSIASVLYIGMKIKPRIAFESLANQMMLDVSDDPSLIQLQSFITMTRIDNRLSSYKFVVSFVYTLLIGNERSGSLLSSLFKYLASFMKWKQSTYFCDSMLHDAEFCKNMAELIEQIEIHDIKGSIDPNYSTTPVIDGQRAALRMKGAVKHYLEQTQEWLLSKQPDIETLQINPIRDILQTYFDSFLIDDKGNYNSLNSLWDLFSAIDRSINVQSSAIPIFRSIMANAKGNSLRTSQTRVVEVVVECLNHKILPEVLLFATLVNPQEDAKIRWISNAKILSKKDSILQIAFALNPLKNISFNIKSEAFKSKFELN